MGALARMRGARERGFAASACGIIWKMMSCRLAVFPRRQKKHTTGLLRNLLKIKINKIMFELINVFWQIFKSTWQIWVFILGFVLFMVLIDYFFKWLEKWRNKKWFEKHKKLEDWRIIDSRKFERITAIIFQKLGYKTKVIGGPGDRGIDIIAQKDGKRTNIQCKRKDYIPPSDIQAFYGAIDNRLKKGEEGIFVTTGGFTQRDKECAKEKNIKLIDGLELEKLAKP
jgi:HJR/Mrr/RecB family endonuclease